MAIAYRLIFEISVYYTLTGVYLQALLEAEPSLAGMVLLCLAIALCALFTVKGAPALWRGLMLLPALTLLFRPGWLGMLHLLPPWLYCAVMILGQRADTDYKAFRRRFSRSFLLLLLAALPLAGRPNAGSMLGNVAVYLIIQLLSGIACLRFLRDRQDGYRHLLSMAAVAVLCLILTGLRVPQFLLKICNDYVLQVVWRGIALLASLVAYCIFEGFKWLLSINGTPPEIIRNNSAMTTTAEIIGVDTSALMSDSGGMLWLEIAVYILLAIAILIAAFFLVRQLVRQGLRLHRTDKNTLWTEERSTIQKGSGAPKRRRRRPQDPRQAVRYYYALYVSECGRRGVKVQPDWTCEDVSRASEGCFSPHDIGSLTQLYQPARYSSSQVTNQQVRKAAKLWQNIKKTK